MICSDWLKLKNKINKNEASTITIRGGTVSALRWTYIITRCINELHLSWWKTFPCTQPAWTRVPCDALDEEDGWTRNLSDEISVTVQAKLYEKHRPYPLNSRLMTPSSLDYSVNHWKSPHSLPWDHVDCVSTSLFSLASLTWTDRTTDPWTSQLTLCVTFRWRRYSRNVH